MKCVAGLGVELSVEERNLISVAYKNVIGARRASWRIISSIESKDEAKGEQHCHIILQHREEVSTKFFLTLLERVRKFTRTEVRTYTSRFP